MRSGLICRETNAKLVNTLDMHRVVILRGHSKSVKHITFHPNGNIVTTSSSDGSIYVFSITSEEASLLKKLEGIIPALDVESETSAKVIWHPDGTAFAAPTPGKGASLIKCDVNKRHSINVNGPMGEISHLQEWTYRQYHRLSLVSQWRLPRVFFLGRKSPHLANKGSNHHHDVSSPNQSQANVGTLHSMSSH